MRFLARLWHIDWRIVAGLVSACGVLHIITTLLVPRVTLHTGYDRLVKDLPLNAMQVMPPVAPAAQRLPFLAPDARYALCHFETRDGAVTVSATLPGPGWVLTLISPEGDTFFTTLAQPGRATKVSLLLVPTETAVPSQLAERQAEASAQDPTLRVVAPRGVAVIRAPDQGDAYRALNAAELKRASCAHRAL